MNDRPIKVVTRADFVAATGLNPDKFSFGFIAYPQNIEYRFADTETEIQALEHLYQLEGPSDQCQDYQLGEDE